MPTMPCPTCREPAEITVLPEVLGGDGPVAVRLLRAPVVVCPVGHRQPATPQLEATLIDAADQQLVRATAAWLRRTDRCAQCREPLVLAARYTERPVPVSVPGGVVTLVVECPMVRCGACGQEQLPSAIAEPLEQAIGAAVAAALEPA